MHRQTWGRDERECDVIRLWRRGHLSEGSIQCYLEWVHRFRAYCRKRRLAETDQLTLAGVDKFTNNYVGPRVHTLAPQTCGVAQRALHAWACALEGLGVVLPSWRHSKATFSQSPVIKEYCSYRRSHNSIQDGTLRRDTDIAAAFLKLMRQCGKPVRRATAADID